MLYSPVSRHVHIATVADLTAVWRTVRGGLRFTDLTVWALVIDPGAHPARLFALAGLPDGPYGVRATQVDELIGEYAAGGSLALLYGRPGCGPWHVGDRAWSRFLERVPVAVPRWPLHRAHDRCLEVAGEVAGSMHG